MSDRRTQADKHLHDALRESGCVCCGMAGEKWLEVVPLNPPFLYVEINHRLSGTKRMGHQFVIPECSYHHQQVAPDGMTKKQATQLYGPSRAGGSKPFHKLYGSDAELQAIAMANAGLEIESEIY